MAFISERFGLIGADEVRAVQAVEISRQTRTLRVLDTITLAPSGSEIDIEAVAAEGDSYYITGSHGASKKKGEEQDNRYSIFRLQVDPATGLPRGFQRGSSGVPAGVQRASLSVVIRADPVLGPHFEQPLQHKGINIEGLAIRNGQLFVGFRSPNLDGYAFVMEIRADDVFSGKLRPPYTLHKLRLGAGLGIREIVAAQSGFLLIAGNAGSEPSKKYPQAEDYEEKPRFLPVQLGRQGRGRTPDWRTAEEGRKGRGDGHPGGDRRQRDGAGHVRRSQSRPAHRLSSPVKGADGGTAALSPRAEPCTSGNDLWGKTPIDLPGGWITLLSSAQGRGSTESTAVTIRNERSDLCFKPHTAARRPRRCWSL